MLDELVAPPVSKRSPQHVSQQNGRSPAKSAARTSPKSVAPTNWSTLESNSKKSGTCIFSHGDLPAFEGIVSMVVKYLTASDLRQLLQCNREWRQFDAARFCLPYLHKLSFEDIRSITEIHSNSTTSMSSSPRHMRRLRKLDLSGYTAPLAAGMGARTPPRPRKAPKESLDSRPGASPLRCTQAKPVPAEEWLQQYVQHRPSLAQLHSLTLGALMPRWMVEACLTGVSAALTATTPGALSRLTALSLKDCAKVDDRLLSCLTSCPTLRVLDLRGCWRVTPAALQGLMTAAPRVHKAMLSGMTRLDDSVLQSLPTRWPCLTVLDLSCESRSWTAWGLARLLRKHAALSHVRVAHAGAGFIGTERRAGEAQEEGDAVDAPAPEEGQAEGDLAQGADGAAQARDAPVHGAAQPAQEVEQEEDEQPAFSNGWQLIMHALAQAHVRTHMRTLVLQDCVGCMGGSSAVAPAAGGSPSIQGEVAQPGVQLEEWYRQQCRQADSDTAVPAVTIVHIADECTLAQW